MTAAQIGVADEVGLVIEEVDFSIGGLHILTGVSMQCRNGQVTGLLGPNGAGKTTLLNCISGLYRATTGRIIAGGQELQKRRTSDVARAGVGRTFQTPQVVEELTVIENVMLGGQARVRQRLLRDGLAVFWRGSAERHLRASAGEQLGRVGLTDIVSKPVAACSHTERRLIELARALCAEPRVLLLDEPCAGMGADGRTALASILATLVREQMAVLLVEHDVNFVSTVSARIAVLDQGRVIAEGDPSAVINSQVVIDAYLGR